MDQYLDNDKVLANNDKVLANTIVQTYINKSICINISNHDQLVI